MSSPPVLLSIDPSVNNLGWAACNLITAGPDPDIYDLNGEAWAYGLIHPMGINVQEKWGDAHEQLVAEMTKIDWWPTHFVAEQPTFFASQKGRIAAQQDHTIRLGQMVAGVAGRFKFPAKQVTLLIPSQWKGSVPKRVTRNKLERLFSVDSGALSDDEVDAIMLAEFWLSGYLRKAFGPPLKERHGKAREDLVQLVQEARDKCRSTDGWHGRISTVLRQRGDIPRGLARRVLHSEFQIRLGQVETILRNA